jgi:streptogramin lyase
MTRRVVASVTLLLALALIAATASAADSKPESPAPGDISAAEAAQAAAKDPNVIKEKREHPGLVSSPNFNNEKWEVGWFEGDHEFALVMVDPKSGEVTE